MTEQVSTHEVTPSEADTQATHEAEMVKVAEDLEAKNNPDADRRPDWLPEKFESAKQMAEAYKHLETKLGGKEQEQEAPKEEVTQKEEVTADNVQEVVENAGLDFGELQNEYDTNGEMSEDSYAKLEEAGFPKGLVDSWIKGQEALATNYQNTIYDSVGGEEAYGELITWAKDNLSDGEIKAFDSAVTSGDMDMVNMAVTGLQSKYQTAEGTDPTLLGVGQSSNSTGGVYNSWAEVTAAMNDTRYQNDVAYRQSVSTKLSRSQL